MKQKKTNKKPLSAVFCILIITSGLTAAGHLTNNTQINNNEKNNILIENKPYPAPLNLDGTILYVGGSGPGNFTKIQDAIDFSKNGDTVFVFDDSSPYFENIIIDKSINLIGEKRHTTIIDGNELGIVVKITSNYVNISKFTIRNCSFGSSAGVRGSTNYSTISNNNIISNNRSGLVLLYSHFNTITGNIINSNRWLGVHLGTCNNNIISGNTIISNIHEGFNQYDSHNNTISGNIVSKNEIGINIGKYCSNNTISGNIVMFNEYGIRFYESQENNSIRSNSIRWNMYGLCLLYSYSNKIEHNNFIRNIGQAYFDYYLPDGDTTNLWNGNFWNRPRILPKVIFGTLFTDPGWIWEPYIEFDRRPALVPNRIGG